MSLSRRDFLAAAGAAGASLGGRFGDALGRSLGVSLGASFGGAPAFAGDARDVVTVARLAEPGPYHRIWQPFLATDAAGRLLCAYGTQLHGKTDMGALWCARSADGGRTWSPPSPVLHHDQPGGSVAMGYANPVLYRAPGHETVWCFAMRSPLFHPDSEFSQLCAAVSVDGGASWRPIELAVLHPAFPITCQHVVRAADAQGPRYLLPLHVHFSPKFPGDPGRAQFVLESRDLLTWRLAGYVPCDPSRVAFLHEGGIAAGDAPGELVMAMRTAAHNRYPEPHPSLRAYVSRSADGGRTWSPAAPEPALYNSVAKGYFGDDGHGTQVYVYNDGPAWQRRALWYVTRPRGGRWSAPRPFFHQGADVLGGAGRNSYPTLLPLGPRRWAAAWDSSDLPPRDRTQIRFGVLDLAAAG